MEQYWRERWDKERGFFLFVCLFLRERRDVTFKVGEIIAWFYADRNNPTKGKTDEAEGRRKSCWRDGSKQLSREVGLI